MLWKFTAQAVYLLLGSPLNILGEKSVQEGAVQRLHPTSTNLVIGRLLNRHVRTDEECWVSVFNRHYPEESVFDLRLDIQGQETDVYKDAAFRSFINIVRREDNNTSPANGLGLAQLCFGPLRKLHRLKIDTIFKVFHEFCFPSFQPFGVENECNTLYLGSPIYTALI